MKSRKVLNNAKWIILCRVAQSVLQLIIGMLSARYLGPANYGLIGYAGSIVAFATPLMQLGLRSTLVNELISTPEKEGEIMGSALAMSMLSSVICIFGVFSFVSIANPGEPQTLIVCVLYSICLIFGAVELIQYWFQYRLESKYPSLVMLVAYFIVSAYKIYLLATGKSIYWFAVVNSIDYGIIGITLVAIYHKRDGQRLKCSFAMAKRLFSKSKYYILASMMVTVFQHTDHVMLKQILGDAENGFYTAAISCTTVCQFVYKAILESAQPAILSAKKEQSPSYEKYVSTLYCIIVTLSVLQGIGFTVFAKLIVQILYGAEYMASVPVLRILVWHVSFSYIGSVRNVWILAEGKQSLLWKINLAGALINIGLNAVLIPWYGACGAAVASLATQIFTNFILGFIIKPIRQNNRLLLKGIDPRFLWKLIRERKFFEDEK